eukprot:40113-Eustigmatos_ZCMA.PRE.1
MLHMNVHTWSSPTRALQFISLFEVVIVSSNTSIKHQSGLVINLLLYSHPPAPCRHHRRCLQHGNSTVNVTVIIATLITAAPLERHHQHH